jgi:hypothetical protein
MLSSVNPGQISGESLEAKLYAARFDRDGGDSLLGGGGVGCRGLLGWRTRSVMLHVEVVDHAAACAL